MKKLRVRVKPGQRDDEVVGFDREGALVVRVKTPAREGKANQRLLELLAGILHVPKSRVKIVSGLGSVHKVLHIPDDARLPLDPDV